ncbi:MAG: DUF3160 domain-containing protein [Phycisphaerales bacterium]|nr:DUF3160 domain-containing protein [Phycisphaerales bacterium]
MSIRLLLCIALGLSFTANRACAEPFEYPNEDEQTLQVTEKSKALDRLLEKNGFVVTTREFYQMFSAYCPLPSNNPDNLPPFITTDSAWHTYHILLEKGVKQLEQRQAIHLKMFSRRLLSRAKEMARNGETDFSKIANYASIALAIQDKKHAATLTGKQKELLAAIRTGRGKVKTPLGGLLMAPMLRANSFYASSQRLSDYFTARQWFALIVFRLNQKDETSLAIRMAMLIKSDKTLGDLWRGLSEPYDSLLGKVEDGDPITYAAAVSKVLGKDATSAQIDGAINTLQKHLQTVLPKPSINDQGIPSGLDYAKLTKGFRLFPPRRTVSSVSIQQAASVPGGPTHGLHFMVACKQMQSPAAIRAMRQEKVDTEAIDKIKKIDPGKLPDSLHGRAMKLLANLQAPRPANAPKALQNQAWSDKQLWTQLGAWAQQRHTWALHTKMAMYGLAYSGSGDVGMVSPYPEFFKSLGALTRQTARVLAHGEIVNENNIKSIAENLLIHAEAYDWYKKLPPLDTRDEVIKRYNESKIEIDRMEEFLSDQINGDSPLFKLENAPTKSELIKDCLQTAKKLMAGEKASAQDMKLLKAFAGTGGLVTNRMDEFASVCDTLASISQQQLAGKKLDARDNGFLRGYGPILARCSFYDGSSWHDPRDDSPLIAPIFVDLNVGFTRYAALGRPRELYVKGKLNGKVTLMRGAVLSYRELSAPLDKPMNDQDWREIVRQGISVPLPPDFTKSFIARPSEIEVINMLAKGKLHVDIDRMAGRKITQTMLKMLPTMGMEDQSVLIRHLQNRCTEEDASVLIKLLADSPDGAYIEDTGILFDLMKLAARTPCKPVADKLQKMLDGENPKHAFAAAYILASQPELVDTDKLTTKYKTLSTYRRGLHCLVLGYLPNPNQTTLAIMLDALGDRDACLRHQGAIALGRCGSKDKAVIKALTQRINDKNTYVAGAALNALQKLNIQPDTTTLLDSLKQHCKKRNRDGTFDFEKQAVEIPWYDWFNTYIDPEPGLFDSSPDYFAERHADHTELVKNNLKFDDRPTSADQAIINELIQLQHKPAVPIILKILHRDGFTNRKFGFEGVIKLDRKNYIKHMVTLALDRKAPVGPRVIAINALRPDKFPANECWRLKPLIADQTPLKTKEKTTPQSISDLAIFLIGYKVHPDDPVAYTNVFDEQGRYSISFQELRQKVRKWAKTTTQPTGK